MYSLNATDARVWNFTGLKLFQPLDADGGTLGDFGSTEFCCLEERNRAFEERRGTGHGRSVGKILLSRQVADVQSSATHYPSPVLAYEGMADGDENDKSPIDCLAQNVKRFRRFSGLSQAKLVKSARPPVRPKTVSNLETGKHSVGIDNILSIADALKVELWQLFLCNLPEDREARKSLTYLVTTFLLLDSGARSLLVKDAELLCLRKGIEPREAGGGREVPDIRPKKMPIQTILEGERLLQVLEAEPYGK